jgi:hypothetical protein
VQAAEDCPGECIFIEWIGDRGQAAAVSDPDQSSK